MIFDTTSSTRVVNKFVKNLGEVHQYSKAEIKRTGEAATLKLNSYEWNFDIVPCFLTTETDNGTTYYLIPNGSGDWKKTDPRKDRLRLSLINQSCNGRVLNVIRVLKAWNQRRNKARIPSYLIETMISNYYEEQISFGKQDDVSYYIDIEIIRLLNYLRSVIYSVVPDPKKIAYDINDVGYDEKNSFYSRLCIDIEKADLARKYESEGNEKEAIKKWQEIFGSDFPEYTGA